jgi:hypothetical protein
VTAVPVQPAGAATSYNRRARKGARRPFSFLRERTARRRIETRPKNQNRPQPTMLNSLLTRVFGSRNERLLRQLQRSVNKINALEAEMQKLSDAELQAKTPEFQQRVQAGESLDKILPEAFAVCR